MALETIQGPAIFDGSSNGIPSCRRAVAENAPPKSVDIYGTWSRCWVEERIARDGWCGWRRLQR